MSSKSFQNASKLNGIVSVLQFGAVGDGVTDDLLAFQAAIATGCTIGVPRGTYKIGSTLNITSPVAIDFGGVISAPLGVTLAFSDVYAANNGWATGAGTITTGAIYVSPWGYSTSVKERGSGASQTRTLTASTGPLQEVDRIDVVYNADAAIGPDFVGAEGGSVPVGLYVQHKQVGSSSLNQAFTHSIMGYAWNNAAGNNDVIAVSGRARKSQVTGGIGDSAGVWGSAYQESNLDGGVMGMETHIYQNVAGSTADDRINAKWSVGLHVFSASTGSPAKAGVAIDGTGQTSGMYGFWNAVIIDKNCFHGSGLDGTVGINCGSWDTNNNPKYGIKFGSANQHIYSTTNLTLAAANSIYLDTSASNTTIFLQLGTSATSNVVIKAGSTSFAEFRASDQKLHLKNAAVVDL